VNKVANSSGHDNGLISGNPAEAASVEMVKMGVRDENKVDGGKVVVGESSVTKAPNDKKPVGPVRIDKNVAMGSLNQEGSVADPGDADLAGFKFRKDGRKMLACAPLARKKSREDDIGDKAVRGPFLVS
jgi:hypothetical protein